jgi:hypothetical protein
MPHKLSAEDLEALNVLVQDGLIEVVSVDPDGTPYYRIASRFLNGTKGPGRKPETLADQSAFGGLTGSASTTTGSVAAVSTKSETRPMLVRWIKRVCMSSRFIQRLGHKVP